MSQQSDCPTPGAIDKLVEALGNHEVTSRGTCPKKAAEIVPKKPRSKGYHINVLRRSQEGISEAGALDLCWRRGKMYSPQP